jgi:methyl-accepting chemotaxis protein-like sensor
MSGPVTAGVSTAAPGAGSTGDRAGSARGTAGDLRQQCARLLASVSDQVGQVLASVDRIVQATASAAAAARLAGRPLQRADLAAVRPLAAALLGRHAGLTAGAGVVLAPGALADVPRCIEWWWADEGSGPEQLQVDLDPESAEFYDYTMTEWYQGPQRTGRPSVAGPYVDYICTHQYTFTLSAPVWCAGEFLGVAGCDILAGQIERLVEPGLAGLGRAGRTAVLVSGSGRVIASNLAGVLPGTAACRQPGCADLVPVAGPPGEAAAGPGVLPWTILSHPE